MFFHPYRLRSTHGFYAHAPHIILYITPHVQLRFLSLCKNTTKLALSLLFRIMFINFAWNLAIKTQSLQPNMKKLPIAILILTCLMLASCSWFNGVSSQLAAVDNIIEQDPDSAYRMLNRISGADLTSPSDSAYYGLLYSQARYKLEKKTDPALISKSIKYYQQHDNPALLQRCYLYKGGILMDNGGSAEDIMNQLKNAEQLIGEVKDTINALKIYEWLYIANQEMGLKGKSLDYAHKLHNLSLLYKNKNWIASALEKMTFATFQNGIIDSSKYYIQQRENAASSYSKEELISMYNDIGTFYLIKDSANYKMAEQYALKSLSTKPNYDGYKLLLDIYLNTNRRTKIENLYNSVLQFGDAQDSARIYGELSSYYANNKMFEKAYLFGLQYDSVCTEMADQTNNKELEELQMKYDSEVIERKHKDEKEKMLSLIEMVILMGAVCIIYLGWKVYRKRLAIAHFNELLAQTKLEINELNDENKEIDERNESLKKILLKQKRNIKEIESKLSISLKEVTDKEKEFQHFEKGLQYLYYAMIDENISQLDKKEREDLISCYRIVDSSFVDSLNNLSGESLTTQEKLYCIFRRMGKSVETIQTILQLSNDAIRKTHSRAINKLKNNDKRNSFVDKIAKKDPK